LHQTGRHGVTHRAGIFRRVSDLSKMRRIGISIHWPHLKNWETASGAKIMNGQEPTVAR
jgi:hypothetical protein